MCKNRQCVTRQLTACPSANSDECSGNGVRTRLLKCANHNVYYNYVPLSHYLVCK